MTINDKKPVKFLEVNLDTNNACNLKCKYCFLGEKKHTEFKKPTFSKEYYDGLDLSECRVIEIWGGEPCFYFGDLANIITYFRERKDCKNTTEIRVLSNGLFLDNSQIDFFIKNNVMLSISHDGPQHEFMRGKDPLKDDNFVNMLKRLPYKITFSCTLSNTDYCTYEDFKRYFFELENRTHLDFTCKIIPVRGTDDFNMKYAFIDDIGCKKIAKFYMDMIEDCTHNFTARVIFLNTLARLKYLRHSSYPCNVHKEEHLAVDSCGKNVMVCHSGKEQLQDMKKCLDCNVIGQCHVSCQVLDPRLREKQCMPAMIAYSFINSKIDQKESGGLLDIYTIPARIVDITHLFKKDMDEFEVFNVFKNGGYLSLMDEGKVTYYIRKSDDMNIYAAQYNFTALVQNAGLFCVLDDNGHLVGD